MKPARNAISAKTFRAAPKGYVAVTPWIISKNTNRLVEFVSAAFRAEELTRMLNQDGSVAHCEFRIGDAVVMAFDAGPAWQDTPAFLRLFVDDADAVIRRALDAGATLVTEPTTLSFGDRVGRVRDPLGNVWWIQAHIDDVSQDEMQRRAGDKRFVDAMAYVQGSLDDAMAGE